jgi:hypothetical protein
MQRNQRAGFPRCAAQSSRGESPQCYRACAATAQGSRSGIGWAALVLAQPAWRRWGLHPDCGFDGVSGPGPHVRIYRVR